MSLDPQRGAGWERVDLGGNSIHRVLIKEIITDSFRKIM